MVRQARERNRRSRLYVLLLLAGLISSVTLLYASSNIGQSELGQADFLHSTVNFVRGKGLNLIPNVSGIPPGIAVDSANGCVYVADPGNNRVLGWHSESSFANGATADIVIGQLDQWSKLANSGGLTNATLNSPTGVATDPAGNLYVADTGNARVVEYTVPCTNAGPYTGNLVFQNSAGEPPIDPWGLATDSLGNLFVADRGNNRVLEYNTPLTAGSGEPGAGDPFVDNIFGQTVGGGVLCNQGSSGPTAGTLCKPNGLATDGQSVYVADAGNNRVLQYAAPATPGVFPIDPSAVLVLGQSSFTTATSGCGAATSQSLTCSPQGLAVDPNRNVYVADTGNNRVLEYNNPPAGEGLPPSLLIGQASYLANLPNADGAVGASTLWSPAGITTDSAGNLFVLDDRNFRALEYDETTNPPLNPIANRELGQIDFGHNTIDFVDGSSLSNPSSVAVDSLSVPQHLYVVDSDNNRVLGFKDATAFATGAPADLVIGQPDFYSVSCNGPSNSPATAPTASTLCLNAAVTTFPQGGDATVDALGNLWVSDDGNSRVLEFSAPFAYMASSGNSAGELATVVLGQPNFTTGSPPAGCVATPSSATNLCEPAGLGFDSLANLYVADFGYNRVLMFPQPGGFTGTPPQAATRVLGQNPTGVNFSGSACNHVGVPTTDNLCGPLGVALDFHNNLYVADSNNSRVLLYFDPSSGLPGDPGEPGFSGDVTADLAFGQDTKGVGNNFTAAVCNNGGITATSMCQPSGVAVDSFGTLFVSDQTNNRVLVFAEGPGSPANVTTTFEFGQGVGVFNTGVANNGGLSAASLSLARNAGQQDGLATDSTGDLYAIDAGNVRVISYTGPFLHAPVPTPTPTVIASPTPTTLLSPSPDLLKLGNVEATATGKAKKLTLENTGAIAAQFAQLTAPSFGLTNDTCSNTSLQPKQKCTVDVTFTPLTVGGVSETITVPYNGTNPSAILSGTGIAAALSAPSSKTLPSAQAGSVGKTTNITISNKSKATIMVGASLKLINSMITSDLCTTVTLAPKATCVVTVEFAPPVGSSGKLTDSLSYSYTYAVPPAPPNPVNTGRVTVALTGTATGDLTVSPKSKKLPAAQAGALGKPVNFTITNETTATIQMGTPLPLINSVIPTGSDSCMNQALAPGAKCVVTVEFAPPSGSFSGETLTDTLSYGYTDGTSSTVYVTVALSGKVSKTKS